MWVFTASHAGVESSLFRREFASFLFDAPTPHSRKFSGWLSTVQEAAIQYSFSTKSPKLEEINGAVLRNPHRVVIASPSGIAFVSCPSDL